MTVVAVDETTDADVCTVGALEAVICRVATLQLSALLLVYTSVIEWRSGQEAARQREASLALDQAFDSQVLRAVEEIHLSGRCRLGGIDRAHGSIDRQWRADGHGGWRYDARVVAVVASKSTSKVCESAEPSLPLVEVVSVAVIVTV